MGPIGVIIKCVSLNELFLTGRTRFKFRQNLTENTKDRGFAKCSSMTEHGMNNRTFPYTSNMHFSINYTSSCCKNMRVCSICKLPVFCDRIEQQPTVDRYICINLSHHSEQHQLQLYVICAQKNDKLYQTYRVPHVGGSCCARTCYTLPFGYIRLCGRLCLGDRMNTSHGITAFFNRYVSICMGDLVKEYVSGSLIASTSTERARACL
jgi:hypothetical protein